jgi:hypothetical protein
MIASATILKGVIRRHKPTRRLKGGVDSKLPLLATHAISAQISGRQAVCVHLRHSSTRWLAADITRRSLPCPLPANTVSNTGKLLRVFIDCCPARLNLEARRTP